MATILEFKLPEKISPQLRFIKDITVSSDVDYVMLMIHHALHGCREACRPKDKKLAVQLLSELTEHINNGEQYDNFVLSNEVSGAIVTRYPELFTYQCEA